MLADGLAIRLDLADELACSGDIGHEHNDLRILKAKKVIITFPRQPASTTTKSIKLSYRVIIICTSVLRRDLGDLEADSALLLLDEPHAAVLPDEPLPGRNDALRLFPHDRGRACKRTFAFRRNNVILNANRWLKLFFHVG